MYNGIHFNWVAKFPQRKSCGHIEALAYSLLYLVPWSDFRNAKVAATLKLDHRSPIFCGYVDFRNAKVAATLKRANDVNDCCISADFRNAKVAATLKRQWWGWRYYAHKNFRNAKVAATLKRPHRLVHHDSMLISATQKLRPH